ncbi:hypothetical protein BD626DRAFT_416560, partial [Schizophyllum amplum]
QGLRLCPAYLKCENFKRDSSGKIVVLDFQATCFLPVSFLRSALDSSYDYFTMLLRSQTGPPVSKNSKALKVAFCALVPHGSNSFGEHVTMLSFR